MKSLKKLILLISMILLSNILFAQTNKKANKDTEAWRYEIETIKDGKDGIYLIKVWSYSKKPNIAIEQAKKNAIHGIIFRGLTATSTVGYKPPLANNVNLEEEKEDFFKLFFADGGKYMKFISTSSDGAVAAEDRMKIGKESKVGVIVTVNVDALRKDLQDAGIIKALGAGFN